MYLHSSSPQWPTGPQSEQPKLVPTLTKLVPTLTKLVPTLTSHSQVKSWHSKPPVYISTAGTATFFPETQSTPVAFVRAFECSTVAPKGCQPNLTTSLIVPHLGPIIFPNQATNAVGYGLARYYRYYRC